MTSLLDDPLVDDPEDLAKSAVDVTLAAFKLGQRSAGKAERKKGRIEGLREALKMAWEAPDRAAPLPAIEARIAELEGEQE